MLSEFSWLLVGIPPGLLALLLLLCWCICVDGGADAAVDQEERRSIERLTGSIGDTEATEDTTETATAPSTTKKTDGNNRWKQMRLAMHDICNGHAGNLIMALRAMEQMGANLGVFAETKLGILVDARQLPRKQQVNTR